MTIKEIDQSKLYIIIGFGRSGTSLLQELMNTFDGFCNDDELKITDEISAYSLVLLYNDFSLVDNLIKARWTKEYFVEKTPNSIRCLPQLSDHFPNANYLFLKRHPLRVLLSHMNMHPENEAYRIRMKDKIMTREFLPEYQEMPYQRAMAIDLYDSIRAMSLYNGLFKNKLILRYEDMVDNPKSFVNEIAKQFNLKLDIKKAKEIMSRPSKSSLNNSYEMKELTGPRAIEITKESCQLWGYDYSNPPPPTYERKLFKVA